MTSKIELINRMQSMDNRKVLQAVEELRTTGMLSDGTLRGTALCQAILNSANLRDADLCFVDLHQADLENADLRHAKLQGSKFNRANLQGADLDSANITNADFYKVNLRGAHNVTDMQLSTLNELFGSIMPDGKVYNGRFNLFGDLARARWAKVNLDDPSEMADFYGVSPEEYLQGQKKEAMALS